MESVYVPKTPSRHRGNSSLICKASPLRQEHRRDQQLPLLGGCASCRSPTLESRDRDEPRFAAFLVHIASKDCTPLSEAVPGGYRQGIHTCAPKGNLCGESCRGRLRCASTRKAKMRQVAFDRLIGVVPFTQPRKAERCADMWSSTKLSDNKHRQGSQTDGRPLPWQRS
jgi:hypothetical protein